MKRPCVECRGTGKQGKFRCIGCEGLGKQSVLPKMHGNHPVTVTLVPNPCGIPEGAGSRFQILMSHSPLTCLFGLAPCIHLNKGVTSRNVIDLLRHEELHHVLTLRLDNDISSAFDNLFADLETTRRLFRGQRIHPRRKRKKGAKK